MPLVESVSKELMAVVTIMEWKLAQVGTGGDMAKKEGTAIEDPGIREGGLG